jgi:hypothetical protein
MHQAGAASAPAQPLTCQHAAGRHVVQRRLQQALALILPTAAQQRTATHHRCGTACLQQHRPAAQQHTAQASRSKHSTPQPGLSAKEHSSMPPQQHATTAACHHSSMPPQQHATTACSRAQPLHTAHSTQQGAPSTHQQPLLCGAAAPHSACTPVGGQLGPQRLRQARPQLLRRRAAARRLAELHHEVHAALAQEGLQRGVWAWVGVGVGGVGGWGVGWGGGSCQEVGGVV